MSKKRLAVFASGRGSNFKAVAEHCARDKDFPAEISVLVTDNESAGAIETAREFEIPWHYEDAGKKRGRMKPGCEQKMVEVLEEYRTDIVFLAGFMRILEDPLLDRYPDKILNIHPSLLPSFKGLRSPQQALDYGVKIAGCSVHFVDKSVDGGPIILQAAVPVEDGDDFDTLAHRILEQEHRIASEAIKIVALNNYRIEGRRVFLEQ